MYISLLPNEFFLIQSPNGFPRYTIKNLCVCPISRFSPPFINSRAFDSDPLLRTLRPRWVLDTSRTGRLYHGNFFFFAPYGSRRGMGISGAPHAMESSYTAYFHSPQVLFGRTTHLPGIDEAGIQLTKCEIFKDPHTCWESKRRVHQKPKVFL